MDETFNSALYSKKEHDRSLIPKWRVKRITYQPKPLPHLVAEAKTRDKGFSLQTFVIATV
jgi:hypothetical protein